MAKGVGDEIRAIQLGQGGSMGSSASDTQDLLVRAQGGDAAALQQLFARHRRRLHRMVSTRMDPRLAARLDPSDVVQEALLVASQRLGTYIAEGRQAFYPWLRQLTFERLVDMHRRHIDRKKRSVNRELRADLPLPDQSTHRLADQLVDNGLGPGSRVMQRELHERLYQALADLPQKYCEVLILRHLEHLSAREAAEVMGLTLPALKARYYRAIARLHERLNEALPHDDSA